MFKKYYLFFLSVFLTIQLIIAQVTIAQNQSDFIKYINKDSFKHYKNGLFLGMFNSQKEAEQYLNLINPITLEPYEVVFAFGMSGDKPWVKVWELIRVVGDNLSWSPLTNYSKINELKFDYLVCHSNGCDVAVNAIKTGQMQVRNLVAFAPPVGFKEEARDLFGVDSIDIYRIKGDPVAEALGKKTLFGIIQKFVDLNIGIINKSKDPLIGIEFVKPWPEKIPFPKINERILPNYFTDELHQYRTIAKSVALEKMYELWRAIDTSDPKVLKKENLDMMKEMIEGYRSKFPDITFKFESNISNIPSYWVSPDSLNPEKSLMEAKTLTESIHGKSKAIIVGNGPEADLMYKNMVQKLGKTNVRRIDSFVDEKTLQLEARKFGAEVVLGVREVKSPAGSLLSPDGTAKQNLSGVDISPKASKIGKGGNETKEKVLKSRPSGDSFFWPVEIGK